MNVNSNVASSQPVMRKLTTAGIAATFKVQRTTPRAAFSKHGHWLGMVPVKLPNGRLSWDADTAYRVLAGEPA